MEKKQKTADEVLEEAVIRTIDLGEDDFELEIWMSTDGKHTVRGKALNPKAKHKMATKLMEMYDYIVDRYGTKQKLNKETYNEPEEKLLNPDECEHNPEDIKHFEVKKAGKNQGRWFKTCKKCGKFMGWDS